jgi:hypothetical protein
MTKNILLYLLQIIFVVGVSTFNSDNTEQQLSSANKYYAGQSSSKRAVNNNWKSLFSATNYKTSRDKINCQNIEKLLQDSLKKLPTKHIAQLKSLEIKNEFNASRGLANAHKIILNTSGFDSRAEMVSVLIHELAHVVDLSYLKGSRGLRTTFKYNGKALRNDDPSVSFYRLSWSKNDQRKKNSKIEDFVSGYATSNVFEDFAESYTMYRLHGDVFRAKALKSEKLQTKYDFIKNNVFNKQEFQLESVPSVNQLGYTWDSTLLEFDLKTF